MNEVKFGKKYWILTTEYPLYQSGGIGTYVFFTAKMLRDKGHDVTIFLCDTSLSRDKLVTENGIRLVRFAPVRTKSDRFLGYNAFISYEFAQVIGEFIEREGPPDILETQDYQGIAYYLQQYKLLGYGLFAGLRILVTCHAPSFICLEYNHSSVYQLPVYWTGQMERSSMRSADMLICPSRYIVEEAKKRMDWNGIKEIFIPNPVEIPGQIRTQPLRSGQIVCFGKLSPLKGSLQLLSYFAELWEDGFIHPLHIIGSTDQYYHPEGMTMKELVRKKYGSFIKKNLLILEGDLSRKKVRERIENAQVVLVPSIFDNLPYTVLEAMSWGKVVLASRQGGQSEVIKDGENGFLFDHFKRNDFQDKLRQILDLDHDALQVISANAIDSIRKTYDPELVYRKKMEAISTYFQRETLKKIFPLGHQMNRVKGHNLLQNPDNELLSVIIPFHNLGKYIRECVKSVLNSDYPCKEIIIVDDGSSDWSSTSILESMKKEYGISIVRNKNQGLPLTRNFGAARAKGRFLAFLDADDTVEKTYYSKAVSVLKNYENVHFVGCWARYFGESDGCWPTFNPEPPYLLVHNMVNSSALVYERESFLTSGLNAPELVYGMEDWDSVISMVKHYCGGVVLPEPLYNYRVRKNSMSKAFTKTKLLHLCRVIGERHAGLYNMYGNEIAQLLNSNGSGIALENPTIMAGSLEAGSKLFSDVMKEKIKNRVRKNKFLRKYAYKIYKLLNN